MTGRKKSERYGGGKGSKVYRDLKERISQGYQPAHWCDGYPDLQEKDSRKKRHTFSRYHVAWLKKFCQEYNFYGGANHKLGSPKKMAERALSEIGGCKLSGNTACQKMIKLVRGKMINIGRQMRAANRIAKVVRRNKEDKRLLEEVPGVEIKRSKGWNRDRALHAALCRYEYKERETVYKLLLHRFPIPSPGDEDYDVMEDYPHLPIQNPNPTVKEILHTTRDIYPSDISDDEIFTSDESSDDGCADESVDEGEIDGDEEIDEDSS